MRRSRPAVLLAIALTSVFAAIGATATPAAAGHKRSHRVCADAPAGQVSCKARAVDKPKAGPNAFSATPSGLSPSQIKTAYNFPTSNTAGAGKTIAIVIAYNAPKAEQDLTTFSNQYGLPLCTSANGCFKRVNQTGQFKNYPHTDSGWALEAALDVQWAHAIAPGAHITLVEAKNNFFSNLMIAEDYAKTHAEYVSNSWDGQEFSSENTYDYHFVQPGVSFFVASGDNGLPPEYPSASPNVISVGGTTLNGIGTPSFSETGWSGSGGGCSGYETAAVAQAGFGEYGQAKCNGKRATPDVSLDADPNSGVAVYTSTSYQGWTGWFTVGGTSASTPMVAGRSAVAGVVMDASFVYGNNVAYRDITLGNNGASCLAGYDLVTGRGSWTG
jgi:subtilase family serine protease